MAMPSYSTIAREQQPSNAAKLGHQTDGGGDHWCAVANTKWGTIPGKAKGNTCWYSYDGKEHTTSDFRWLESSQPLQKKKNHGGVVPEGAVPSGHQNDGAGVHYSAVAITKWGDIPGKAKGNTCWYPYGMKEHTTSEFYWVVCGYWTIAREQQPSNAAKLGHQTDGGGDHWCAVANTKWGTIPGKAKGYTCWYSYAGREHTTSDFRWLESSQPLRKKNNGGVVPDLAVLSGHQNDGAGVHYSAVAITKWGDIPGKAKGNTCWYPYGMKEHTTSEFYWVVCG